MEEILIPNDSRHDVVTYELVIDETPVDPSMQVMSISICKEANRIPSAHIVLRDGEASEQTFALSEQGEFVPGKKITIKIGRDGDNQELFSGIIIKHAIKVKENGNGELCLECRDETVKMSIGRHSKYFEQVTDSQVFDELIGSYDGLQSDSESTSLNHKELVQHHVTDWDFLLMRAEANGMLVLVDDGSIKIGKPQITGEPVLQLTYGASILEFEAEMDARDQWKKVQAQSWDYSNQQLFEAESTSSTFTQHGNIPSDELAEAINLEQYEMQHSGHLLEQELQDWVTGVMLRSHLAKIRGRAKFFGFAEIKPGQVVKLDGVGERFQGNAYVTAIRHEMSNGIWDTHVQFGLDPDRYSEIYTNINDAPSAGLLGAIRGLQIGKVVQLQDDPDGENRILVRIPVIDDQAQGIWTRVASLDAGANRGAFFMPEIDDEVIVGFINNDPRDAVMLGMLHSSALPAPLTAEDVNHVKGFTTRSDMHVEFNDDTKTITIDTPAGNSITLDESGTKIEIKDQSDNVISMESNGITMESPNNIEIKAGINLTLSAGATLSVEGATVGIKADGPASLEGATSKVSSSGITEVTGSMVKIN